MSWKIMIMAGGTGGHIFPAMAVAEKLLEHDFSVSWLGAKQGMEAQLVSHPQISLNLLDVSAIRGGGFQRKFLAPLNLTKALLQAKQVINRVKPDLVIGFGGYASGPGAIAAWLNKIPVFIHEQNGVPGMTNRVVARWAKGVMQAFPDTFADQFQAITVGNPVRDKITQIEASEPLAGRKLRVLVIGGSSGAVAVNQIVPAAVAKLEKKDRPEIWHQTGKDKLSDTKAHYEELQVDARLDEFIDQMEVALQWSDLVVCRSGASTISELAVAGKPALLVPYPWHKDKQQYANANYLLKAGAARVIEQRQQPERVLLKELKSLIAQPEKLQQMAERARQQGVPDSAERVVKIIEKFLVSETKGKIANDASKIH